MSTGTDVGSKAGRQDGGVAIGRRPSIARGLAAVGFLVASLAGIVAADPASASVSCSTFNVGGNGGGAYCGGGTGSFQVIVDCRRVGFNYQARGPWLPIGGGYNSVADCGIGGARRGVRVATISPI